MTSPNSAVTRLTIARTWGATLPNPMCSEVYDRCGTSRLAIATWARTSRSTSPRSICASLMLDPGGNVGRGVTIGKK